MRDLTRVHCNGAALDLGTSSKEELLSEEDEDAYSGAQLYGSVFCFIITGRDVIVVEEGLVVIVEVTVPLVSDIPKGIPGRARESNLVGDIVLVPDRILPAMIT